nr:hypothetical protein [Aureimonas sp. AU20]
MHPKDFGRSAQNPRRDAAGAILVGSRIGVAYADALREHWQRDVACLAKAPEALAEIVIQAFGF